MKVTTININVISWPCNASVAMHYLLFIFFRQRLCRDLQSEKKCVQCCIGAETNVLAGTSAEEEERRTEESSRADWGAHRAREVALLSPCLCALLSLSGLAIRQQIALRPTSLLCRPPAALLSNHPERVTRWDTLTLPSDVMQDFQKKKKEKLLVHALCHCVSKIGFRRRHTHTLPNDRNANSYTSRCERIPCLTPNPLKPVLLAVKEATCEPQSCDRWWAKKIGNKAGGPGRTTSLWAAQSWAPAPRFPHFSPSRGCKPEDVNTGAPWRSRRRLGHHWRKCRTMCFSLCAGLAQTMTT